MSERRRGGATVSRVVVATIVAVPLLVAAGFAGPARASESQCAAPGRDGAANAWAQRLLAPSAVWPLTTGAGQTVAVLDSGVDATVPQLRGRVSSGYDAITGRGRADTDCLGTGTHVAGTIAGAKSGKSGLYGMAPAATIMPVRVIGEPGANISVTPTAGALARAITWATDHHADVIDVSVWLTVDDPAVRQAVADAATAGITVVAAAGDLGSGDDGNPATYPAAYPHVIGVAAVDIAGQPWESSEHGSSVDLAAPGAGVPVFQRGHGVVDVDGSTAVAAGFVSGTAALVRARWAHSSATQISERLLGTASPTSGGAYYGNGVVNPYLAVTSALGGASTGPAPGLAPLTRSAAQQAATAARRHSEALSTEWTVIALGALLVVMLFAVGVPRARRRAWRPTYARAPVERPEPLEPEPVALLFDDR